MNAVILCCWLCCIQQPQQNDLVKPLAADYQELLKKERHALPLRQAANVLEQHRQWWPDQDALGLLRRSRSRAGVPLLLKYLMTHPTEDGRNASAYLDLLTLLTGEDLHARLKKDKMNPQGLWSRSVEFLVRDWWLPNKEKIVTDVGKMTPEQVERVASQLLKQVETNDRQYGYGDQGKPTASSVSHKLSMATESNYPDRPSFWEEELHPAMVPVFLSLAGYDPKAKGAGPRETYRVLYAAVPLLANLRNNGEAPDLDKIAEDKKQNSAVRLTCILALYHAGEDLRTRTVLSLLETEKNFERRLVEIALLGWGRETKEVVPRLVELLDDKNQYIREAAVLSLKGRAPPAALPQLKKLLDEPVDAISDAALRTIAAMETRQAVQVLADHLESVLQQPARSRRIYDVLSGFQTATGQSWIQAGASGDAYYRARARAALDWWKSQK